MSTTAPNTHPANDNGTEFFPIADMAEWDAFWSANAEAIDTDEGQALTLACRGELMVGGGAAPLFRVGFVGLRINVHPLFDEHRPALLRGSNYIAYRDATEPGEMLSGSGTTEADAVADLLSRERGRQTKARIIGEFDRAIAALAAAE